MNAQQLKNSILQMAVSGKLVPQDPNDEPASVLLERIRKEKEKLIKEGKIKKEKNHSYIFRGADNTPYEKVGKNEPVSIADEVPFEIPESWEWCRLSDLTVKEIKRGKSPTYIASSGTLVFAQKCNVKTGGIDMSLAKFLDEKTLGKYPGDEFMQDLDIVVNSTGTGTMGRIGLFRITDNPTGFPIVPDSHVTVVRLNKEISVHYLICCLRYYQPYLEDHGEGSTNQKELKPDTIKNLFIPLPPVSEQQRISDIVTNIEPCIIAYGEKDAQLAMLNKEFPDQLKKSILQLAVQGKLVPQDPNDEPARVLLERIRTEKEQLIREGKIKRDKNESVIFRRDNSHYEKRFNIDNCIDEELPFDLPDTWTWCRLSSLLVKASTGPFGSMLHKEDYTPKGIPLINPANIINGQISEAGIKYVSDETAQRLSSYRLNIGDVVIGRRGEMGRSAVVKQNHDQWLCGTGCFYVTTCDGFVPDYLVFLLKAPCFQGALLEKSVGTTMNNLNHTILSELLIPLPPTSEQIRIMNEYEHVCSLLPS